MNLITNMSILRGQIEEIIGDAEKELIIVSPYIQLKDWPEVKKALERYCNSIGTKKLTFAIRDNEEKPLREVLPFKEYGAIYSVKNLHAKIYLNEKKVILTSLNWINFNVSLTPKPASRT